MASHFFYGTLRYPPLLAVVLGREVTGHKALMPGYSVHWALGHSFPMIQPNPTTDAEGLLVTGLTEADVARLDFYQAGFSYRTQRVKVEACGAVVAAQVYFAEKDRWAPGDRWQLDDWARILGETACATAHDFMAEFGRGDADQISRRYPMMLVRGAARVRAGASAPSTLRRDAAADDVQIHDKNTPYASFFAVEDYELSHRKFDGSMSDVINRAVFISGDAATVLPYDPVRDRVLLIEQFRPGPFARGDSQPWLLEPIAGRIDAGETPEAAARREALEEAGLSLGDLIACGQYYPTPAAKSEFLYSYIGLADLPDGAVGRASGVAGEHEDIRSHLVSFEALMALLDTGEAANGPLLISALWLAAHRDRLRQGATTRA